MVGSTSHDVVWEWSDLEIVLIYQDGYSGPKQDMLLENNIRVNLTIFTYSGISSYIGNIDVSNFFFCALSKGSVLFCRDDELLEIIEDSFYIGKKEQEVEQLLGFSSAVYYLNKVEKNIKIKDDIENAYYFMTFLNEGLAWIEVAKNKEIPEREIIKQGKRLNSKLFANTYDVLNETGMDRQVLYNSINAAEAYLMSETEQVYATIIDHLKLYGNLNNFKIVTRDHGFGINYEWLVRYGIAERYAEPIENNRYLDGLNRLCYRLKTNVEYK